jgi:hypothetical protein
MTIDLLDTEIWADNAFVRAFFQVNDVNFDAHVNAQQIKLVISPTPALRNISTSVYSSNISTVCTTVTSTGQCNVAAVIPTTWYDDRFLRTDQTVPVYFGLNTATSPLFFAGNITLKTALRYGITASSNATTNHIQLTLPRRTLFRGTSFTVPVWGSATSDIQSFTLQFFVSAGLRITAIAFNTSAWTASPVITGSGMQAGISANIKDENSLLSTPVAAKLLLTITVSVLNNATEDSFHSMSAAIGFLSNSDEPVLPGGNACPTFAMIVDRSGESTLGQVFVARDRVVSILPYLDQSEIVNTAMIQGTILERFITVRSVSD